MVWGIGGELRWFALPRGPFYSCVTHDVILCASFCVLCVFLGIYSWVPALHSSPKLVEMVRVKFLSVCLVIYLVLNDAKVGSWIFNLRAGNNTPTLIPCSSSSNG
jgi:hypothetical protein